MFAASSSLPSFGTSVFVDSTGLTFRPSLFPLLFGGSFLASFAGQRFSPHSTMASSGFDTVPVALPPTAPRVRVQRSLAETIPAINRVVYALTADPAAIPEGVPALSSFLKLGSAASALPAEFRAPSDGPPPSAASPQEAARLGVPVAVSVTGGQLPQAVVQMAL